MNEFERREIVDKLVQMRRFAREIRNGVGMPQIEELMRMADLYCRLASWFLGEEELLLNIYEA